MPPESLRQRPSIITRRLARGRYIVISLIIAITLPLAWQAWHIPFNFSVDGVYAEDDPEVRFYHDEVVPVFGSSEQSLVLLVSADDLLSPAPLRSLVAIYNSLAAVPGLQDLHALVNLRVPLDREEGLDLVPLFEGGQAPQSPEQIATLSARLDANPNISAWLLSTDHNTTALIAQLKPTSQVEPQRSQLIQQLRGQIKTWQQQHPTLRLRLAGIPVFAESISALMRQDQMRFIPAALAVMALLLWLTFRTWRGTFLPFLATGTATLWTLGVMQLRGHSINLANSAIIVLLLVIGVSDAVHLIARFNEELRRQRQAGITPSKLKTVAIVTDKLGVACLLTSLTSAIGFASLVVAKLVIIRDFGLDAGLGVLLAYFVTLGLIPALLGILPLPKVPKGASADGSQRRSAEVQSEVALGSLARLALKHPRKIVVMALLLTGFGLLGATRLRGHDRILADLPDHHPAIETLKFAATQLGGVVPFDLVIETPAGRADDADVIAGLAAINQSLTTQDLRSRCMSVMDLINALDVAVRGPEAPPLPWTRDRIAQYLLILDMSQGGSESLQPYLSGPRDMLRVACYADDQGTAGVLRLKDNLAQVATQVLPKDSLLHITGPLVITSSALTLIVRDMLSSLALAMLVILVVMGLLFRSARIGLLALVPNAVPILMTLGAMGWFGLSLRPGTAVIFSMALGLAVDNSIHFLSRYREELRGRQDLSAAIEAAVRGTGRPILYTTIMLSLGLAVLLLSDFVAMQQLAILGSVTFVSAMVVDLLLLPVLLLWVKPK